MPKPAFASSIDAEAAFYRAIEEADLELMSAVWADDTDLICVHPMRTALRGRSVILQSWGAMLQHGPPLRFNLLDQQCYAHADVHIHSLYESITVQGENEANPPLAATNIYRHYTEGWRIISHHASICAADELAPASDKVLH
ncbi:MAG: nuclear transport factor 2 family protein [Pseudomonadota bacterium]